MSQIAISELGDLTTFREDTTWVDTLVAAILAHGGEADLSEIYRYIKENTNRTEVPSWPQNARQRIYENSSDSIQFRGEDIFYSVGGLRSGRWGIRREWLANRGIIELDEEDLRRGEVQSLADEESQKPSGRTWYDEIFDAIKANDGVATLSEIYDWIETNAPNRLTTAWRTSVRRSLYDYSSDSDGYKGWRDLFYAVGEIGNGVWAIRAEWLEEDTPSEAQLEEIPTATKGLSINVIPDQNETTERIESTSFQLKRNVKLARLLKENYSFRCQVCRKRIKLANGYYVETHHIRPRNRHLGKDVWENMIVLCPEHHIEFDYGVLGINPKTHSFVHKYNREIDGRAVILKPPHKLGQEFIVYAWENVFSH